VRRQYVGREMVQAGARPDPDGDGADEPRGERLGAVQFAHDTSVIATSWERRPEPGVVLEATSVWSWAVDVLHNACGVGASGASAEAWTGSRAVPDIRG
jgi:hypothetical protein